MAEVKYMVNQGWDIAEEKMLKRLSQFAKEGWLLESMTAMKFQLIKVTPEDLIYAMDYQKNVEDLDEYFAIFTEAGWSFVCELSGFRIFSAPKGTKEIYTDDTNLKEMILSRKKKVFLVWCVSVLGIAFNFFIEDSLSNKIIEAMALLISIICAGTFGFTSVWLFGLIMKKGRR